MDIVETEMEKYRYYSIGISTYIMTYSWPDIAKCSRNVIENKTASQPRKLMYIDEISIMVLNNTE